MQSYLVPCPGRYEYSLKNPEFSLFLIKEQQDHPSNETFVVDRCKHFGEGKTEEAFRIKKIFSNILEVNHHFRYFLLPLFSSKISDRSNGI